jgi:cyclophilin family peptidyl-prolyl cis-trans isomerase
MLKEYDLSEIKDVTGAIFHTEKGDVKVELYKDETPNTVANFVSLAKDGFYDGLNFHRVIAGFMAQGGCPYGTGTGGPEWSIACECDKNTHKHVRGSLSMAHAGRDTGGSQFFICFVDCPHLDGVHTIFGGIKEGDSESFEVLDSIRQGDKIESVEIV